MRRSLHGYLDDEVVDSVARAIEDHLRDCDDCASEAASYRELRAAVRRHAVTDRTAVARLRALAERLGQS